MKSLLVALLLSSASLTATTAWACGEDAAASTTALPASAEMKACPYQKEGAPASTAEATTPVVLASADATPKTCSGPCNTTAMASALGISFALVLGAVMMFDKKK
jgi:hypothetical protein